jgi:hypothetical protein
MTPLSINRHLQVAKAFLLSIEHDPDGYPALERAYALYKEKGTYALALQELCGLQGFQVTTPEGDVTYSLAASEAEALDWRRDLDELSPDAPLRALRMNEFYYEREAPHTPLHLFDAAVLRADLRRKSSDPADLAFASETTP